MLFMTEDEVRDVAKVILGFDKKEKGQYLLCDVAKIRNIKRCSFLFVIDKKDNPKGLPFLCDGMMCGWRKPREIQKQCI